MRVFSLTPRYISKHFVAHIGAFLRNTYISEGNVALPKRQQYQKRRRLIRPASNHSPSLPMRPRYMFCGFTAPECPSSANQDSNADVSAMELF